MSGAATGAPQRLLVTGGAGFVGAHLCARLLAEGHEVICLDSLQTGSRRHLERTCPAGSSLRFVHHDVTAPLPAALTGAGAGGRLLPLHGIYNLACPASPVHYQRDPVGTLKTCVLGALHVLELARATGARVLQASTSEVYGDPSVHPQPETYRGSVSPTGVRACYDEGKRAAETLFFDHARQYGVAIRVARIFNTYGPGMHPEDGRVVANFVVQALRGAPLTVYGDGQQSRSFCYVDDLVDGLVALMRGDDACEGPVNLGNPDEFTVEQLAELVLEFTGSAGGVVRRPLPADDPCRRRPDIGRAIALLGWRPRVPLRAGLRRTIDDFVARGRA